MSSKTAIKEYAVASVIREGSGNPEHGCTLDISAIRISKKVVLRILYRNWMWAWTTSDYPYAGTVESLAEWVEELNEYDAESIFAFADEIKLMEREYISIYEDTFQLSPRNLPLLVEN